MKPKHNVELQNKICMEFGADLDSELCQEVGALMEECPECKVYYDTMKRSVQLFRVIEDECEVPDAVSERLFKVLELEKLKKDS
jgi:ferredoxin